MNKFEGERRRALRVSLMKRAEYTLNGVTHQCILVNISKLGLAFVSDEKHEIGDIIHIKVLLDQLVSIYATIVRMEETKDAKHRYLYGAVIEAIPQQAIDNYINKILQETDSLCKDDK